MKRFKRWFYTVALCLIVGVGLACAVACKDEAPEHTHAFISEVEAVAPTCDKAGEIVRFCSCGFTSTVSLAPLGHDTARFAEQAATCEEGGWTAYEACARCGYTTYEEIAALGHDLVSYTAQEPTCERVGWAKYEVCSRCNYTTYEESAALGHLTSPYTAQAPTCEEIGWNAYEICTRCEYTTYNELPALGHALLQYEGKEATCLEYGWEAYEFCSRCEYTTYRMIPALGHDCVLYEAQEPTCEAVGWNAYESCTRCAYTTYAELAALGHNKEYCEVKVPVSCEKNGLVLYVCMRCGYDHGYEVIKAPGHKIAKYQAQEVGCATSGWGVYEACEREGCGYTTQVILPPIGHDWKKMSEEDGWAKFFCLNCAEVYEERTEAHTHVFDEYKITVMPTCEGTGIQARKCGCGTIEETEVPALGHSLKTHEGKAPTCESIGWERYAVCEREGCDYSTYREIVALQHFLTKYEGKEATCKSYGWAAYETCARCEYTTYQQIPALPHEKIVDNAVESTCEKIGLTEGAHCKKCGKVLVEQAEIPPKGHCWDNGSIGATATVYTCLTCGVTREEKTEEHTHVFDETEITLVATCEKDGIKTLKCSCGEAVTETLSALGHALQAYGGKAATCEMDGWVAYETCNRCEYTTYQPIEALGHNYQNGVCENCGKCSYEGTMYELSADGTYYICVGRRSENDRFIVIEDEWLGVPVKEIEEKAFEGCETLVSVTIGKNVEKIGKNAFYECYNLVEVYNRSVLTVIAGQYSESQLGPYIQAVYTSAEYESGIKTDDKGFVTYTAGGETRLIGYTGEATELALPSGVTQIVRGVFSHCVGLKKLTLSDTVKTIGAHTFQNCASLTEVVLGTGVTMIEAYAFSGATVLNKVIFPKASGWRTTANLSETGLSVSEAALSDATMAAYLLINGDCAKYWLRG